MPTWFDHTPGLFGVSLPAWLVFLPILAVAFLVLKVGTMVILGRRYYKRRAWVTEGGPIPATVTVIVPAYNEELGIGNTLQSLEQQTFPGLEVLVVDDGSTDLTVTVANEVARTMNVPTRVLSKPNGGKADALNFGLASSRTEIVLCVDADSALAPDAVERIVESFANPSVGGVGGIVRIANRSSFLGRLQAIEYIAGLMLLRACFAQLDSMQILSGPISAFRAADLKLIGGYSEDTVVEDFDVTVAMHKAGHRVLFHPGAVSYTEGPQTVRDLVKQRKRWTYGCFQVLKKHRRALFTGQMRRLSRIGLPYILIFPWIDVLTQLLFWATLVYCILAESPLTFLLFVAVLCILTFSLNLYAVHLGGEDKRLAFWGMLIPLTYQHLIAFVTLRTGIQFLLRREARWDKLSRHGGNALPADIGANALPVGIYDFVGIPPEQFVSLDK
jgi:cellulose synthase/poly-beta-1,6-N-acetylglucosamine synthase-like glycosyltransferase